MSQAAGIVSFEQALTVVLQHASGASPVRQAETVPVLDSSRRILAQTIVADRDQPPFDRATRDGFAVRAAEWSAGARLKISGQVRAGEIWQGADIPDGGALEIMTGAPVPSGTDSVAMVEHAQQDAGEVWAAPGRSLRAGENIVPRGSEARQGDTVLPAGTKMSAAGIALAAACGYMRLEVCGRPHVAIISTGDELVNLDQSPLEHQIRNSNSYALAAMVQAAGGQAHRLATARDTREDVRERIAQGRTHDLMILSGGVSAGKYDLVEEVLTEFGAEFFFTGVRMQPGKPVVFGRLPTRENATGAGPECYFFGLPGNPISTQVTFHCFAEPLLRALCGEHVTGPRFVQATLAEEVHGKPGLTRILPAALTHDLKRPQVRPVGWQGSGDLAANARANCYAVLPDGQDLHAGDVISVLLR